MDHGHVVLDISSDEEKGFDGPEGDDFSWISKFLCDEADDSDEVVVVGEIKSKSSKSTVNNEDDDDCIVLDGDPDKPVSADDDGARDEDEDDLVVVAQKGQIACRDYPHSRHLCAKFPFSSTAHEMHCDLCHCYVCDSVAPCAHWGAGVSDSDHCHATEKDEFWKSQRKSFRLQKDSPFPVKVPYNSIPTAFSQLNQTPPRDIIRLASDSTPQNQLSRPAIIRTCSSSNRLNIPSIISQARSRQSGSFFSKNRCQTRLVSQQSHVICRNRGLNRGNIGTFRGATVAGDVSANQPMYVSANNTRGAHASQCTHNPAPQAQSNDDINMRWVSQDSCAYQSFSQTGSRSVFVSSVPSQSQVFSQPIPEPQVYSQAVPQPPLYSHPIPQPPVYTQPVPELLVSSQRISQPHEYTEHISESNDGLNISELCNQRENTSGPGLADFDSWVDVSGSTQQPPVENCQPHRRGSTNEAILFQDFNSHCNGDAKIHYSDLEFDPWFQENYSNQGQEAYLHAPYGDAGMLLFDFETSLAHV